MVFSWPCPVCCLSLAEPANWAKSGKHQFWSKPSEILNLRSSNTPKTARHLDTKLGETPSIHTCLLIFKILFNIFHPTHCYLSRKTLALVSAESISCFGLQLQTYLTKSIIFLQSYYVTKTLKNGPSGADSFLSI